MALPSYSTGTVSIDVGGTTATGVGTIWTGGNAREGDDIVVDGVIARIVDVVSATELTITKWTGAAVSAAAYIVYQNAARRFDDVNIADDLRKQVAALNTEGFYHFVPPGATEPDPSLGDDGQYAFQATTGNLWVKSGGVWVSVGVYKGVNPRGAWNSATAYAVNDVVSRNGNAYMAMAANTNSAPPSANWMVLGAAGADATVTVSGTTTGAPGSDAAVTSGGTPTNRTLGFTIPRGSVVTVGTTTTGSGGSNASVTNSGTGGDVVLNFTVPAGKSYGATSNASIAIGTGSKAFTGVVGGSAYVVGDRVHIGARAAPLNWMEGYVTAFAGTTLTVNVTDFDGTGTFNDWGIGITGKPGLGDGDMKGAANLADVASKIASFDTLHVRGSNVASAATIDLDAATGDLIAITGSTTISAITLSTGRERTVYFSGVMTLQNGANLVLPGNKSILTAIGDIAVFRALNSTLVVCVSYTSIAGPAIPAGHIVGITLSNNTTDATNDIDFADGECASDATNPVLMRHTAGTAQIDVAFGTGNGGRFDSAVADGTWHCFVISNGIDVKRGFSQSLNPTSQPNYPVGYTQYRRVGSILRASSANLGFVQVGRRFMRASPAQAVSTTNPGTSAISATMFVPSGISVWALLTCILISSKATTTYRLLVTPLTIPDATPTSQNCQLMLRTATEGETRIASTNLEVQTSTAREIRYRVDVSDTSITANINVHGWIDDLLPD